MEEITQTIINNIIANFDFPFCITVNIGTYIIIKVITDYKKKTKISTWNKRLIFVLFGLITSIIYCITGSDIKIIFNSFIIAPISWSWIFKPICDKLKIGYNSKVNSI